jgi:hypothetical protein
MLIAVWDKPAASASLLGAICLVRLAAVSNPARHAGRTNRYRPRIRSSDRRGAAVRHQRSTAMAGILSHSGVPWSLRPNLGRLDLHPDRRRSDPHCSRTDADQPLGNAHPPIQVVNTDQVESLRRSSPRADVGHLCNEIRRLSMTIQFSRRGMAARPARALKARSSLVRRLFRAHDDPGKQRIRAWLRELDDEQLVSLGLTPEDILVLRH